LLLVSVSSMGEGVACDRTVAHNNGCLLLDGLLGDADGEIIGEQDARWRSPGGRVDVFLEQAHVVPSAICEFLGVSN